MATPRASGFWANDDEDEMTGYFPDDAAEREGLIPGNEDADGRTPLDRTIDMIGMGSYQWTLLSLCGFGWLADNMWVQAVAIILPRVQDHYDVPDNHAGLLSSSVFAGMMFGAIGWGSFSDIMGRSAAFNGTLFFTAVFGLAASFVNSFPALCFVMFLLGSSVGGSMPTDGTLLLEHMPNGKQHLVTALSVFFSVGAVIAAIVALLVVPQNSCKHPCDVDADNKGWKYLLLTLGGITLTMFIGRIIFFRLHESPRYLVSAGRPQEAIESLQLISKYNGEDLTLDLADVVDHAGESDAQPPRKSVSSPPRRRSYDVERGTGSTTVFDAGDDDGDATPTNVNYSTMDSSSPPPLNHSTYSFTTPASEGIPAPNPIPKPEDAASPPATPRPGPTRPRLGSQRMRRRSSVYEQKVFSVLPRFIRKPLWAWWDRMSFVLAPEWIRTTLVIWAVWCAMSLAYTIFNVFLPKLLETRGVGADGGDKTLEESLWDVVIFTLGGCPGPLLGAWMVNTSALGKRLSLAGSTFFTGFFCLVFVFVESSLAVKATTVVISLSGATMWAVLYGWTPEIFETKIRGSACGIASALSRIGGMIAPVLGGMFLMISKSLPVYTSAAFFVLCSGLVLMLSETEGASGGASGVMVH